MPSPAIRNILFAETPLQRLLRESICWFEGADAGAGSIHTALRKGGGVATTSRASVATTVGRSGLILSVASGVLRSNYSLATPGLFLGYLSEPAGTQLVTPTAAISDLTNAAWIKSASMTVAFTSVGPDGNSNSATRCTAGAANQTCLLTLVAGASSRTVSLLVRRITGSGPFELTQDGAAFTARATTDAYTLVDLNASVLNASYGFRIVTSGDAFDVAMVNFEAGTVATSRMLTTGAARAADVLTYQVAGNLSVNAGTCFAQATLPAIPALVRSIVGTSPTGRLLETSTGADLRFVDAAVNVTTGAAAFSTTTPVSISSDWSGIVARVYSAGTLSATGVYSGTLDTANPIGIGCFGTATAQTLGTTRNAILWPRPLTAAEHALLNSSTF